MMLEQSVDLAEFSLLQEQQKNSGLIHSGPALYGCLAVAGDEDDGQRVQKGQQQTTSRVQGWMNMDKTGVRLIMPS